MEIESVKKDLKRFFELLDKTEESSNGRTFHPNYISSCRVLDGKELGEILERLNKFTGEH